MRKIIFNKIKFINITEDEANKIINKKGLFVFPAAPPLATLKSGSLYHNALIKSDFVFFDSGFLVLLLNFLKGIKVFRGISSGVCLKTAPESETYSIF